MGKPQENDDKSRRSLSEIKKGPVRGLKNILSSSQELTWPILKEEKKLKRLEKVLEELLPEKKKPLRTISWFQLRKLSKEERNNLKKKNSAVETSQNDNTNNILNSMTFGINSVTKTLEKDDAYCILLDSSVDPLFMIKHIVILAQNKHTPVIIIPSLKTITSKKVGFASSALAVKKSMIGSHLSHFDKLHEIISELTVEFSKSTTIIETFDDNSSESSSCSAESTVDTHTPCEKPIILSSIYKYRSTCKERVFVPMSSKQQVSDDTSVIKNDKMSDEFISLNSCNDMVNLDDTFERITKKRRYVDNFADGESRIKKSKNKTEDVGINNGNNSKNSKNSSKVKNVKPKLKNIDPKKKKLMKNTQKIYLPLKVKQIKKNPNRLRATKLCKP